MARGACSVLLQIFLREYLMWKKKNHMNNNPQFKGQAEKCIFLRSNIREVLRLQTCIFSPSKLQMLCRSLKWYGVNFLPPLPSVQSAVWQLSASLSIESSVSSDRRLMGLQPMRGNCPPASGHAIPAKLYPRDDTLSPSVWLGWCPVTQPGVCASLRSRVSPILTTKTGDPVFGNSMKWLMCSLVPLVILHLLWFVSAVSHSLSMLSALFIIQNQM